MGPLAGDTEPQGGSASGSPLQAADRSASGSDAAAPDSASVPVHPVVDSGSVTGGCMQPTIQRQPEEGTWRGPTADSPGPSARADRSPSPRSPVPATGSPSGLGSPASDADAGGSPPPRSPAQPHPVVSPVAPCTRLQRGITTHLNYKNFSKLACYALLVNLTL